MKLDKIKFAKVVSWITRVTNGLEFAEDDLIELNNIIDINIPKTIYKSDVDELLSQIINPDGFIPAIKAYRLLTGADLKESKEAIEKYRVIPNFTHNHPKVTDNGHKDNGGPTLYDILHATGRTKADNDNI